MGKYFDLVDGLLFDILVVFILLVRVFMSSAGASTAMSKKCLSKLSWIERSASPSDVAGL